MSRPVIVTVAPTGGSLTRAEHPHVRTQPEEIADDVARCAEAGASLAALHARRPDDQATCDGALYARINALVRERCDIVVNNSTGGGTNGDMVRDGADEVSWEARLAGLEGGADMCTLDAMTFVACDGGREVLMRTPPSRGRELADTMRARGIKPEFEAFSPTHLVQDVAALAADPPHLVNIVLGLDAVFQGAMPYTPATLRFMVGLLPPDSLFSLSVVGPAPAGAHAHAVALGGHIRAGLEDQPYDAGGRPLTNVECVERAVAVVRALGHEPATPAQARELLNLEAVR